MYILLFKKVSQVMGNKVIKARKPSNISKLGKDKESQLGDNKDVNSKLSSVNAENESNSPERHVRGKINSNFPKEETKNSFFHNNEDNIINLQNIIDKEIKKKKKKKIKIQETTPTKDTNIEKAKNDVNAIEESNNKPPKENCNISVSKADHEISDFTTVADIPNNPVTIKEDDFEDMGINHTDQIFDSMLKSVTKLHNLKVDSKSNNKLEYKQKEEQAIIKLGNEPIKGKNLHFGNFFNNDNNTLLLNQPELANVKSNYEEIPLYAETVNSCFNIHTLSSDKTDFTNNNQRNRQRNKLKEYDLEEEDGSDNNKYIPVDFSNKNSNNKYILKDSQEVTNSEEDDCKDEEEDEMVVVIKSDNKNDETLTDKVNSAI